MGWLLGVWKGVTSDYGGIEVLYCGQLEHTEKVTLGKGKEYTFVRCLPRSCWYSCNSLTTSALAARACSFGSIFLYSGRQQVESVGNTVILTAGIPVICLSGLRSRDATFPPLLHFCSLSKRMCWTSTLKNTFAFTVLFMIGLNFTLCCKSSGMCLPGMSSYCPPLNYGHLFRYLLTYVLFIESFSASGKKTWQDAATLVSGTRLFCCSAGSEGGRQQGLYHSVLA